MACGPPPPSAAAFDRMLVMRSVRVPPGTGGSGHSQEIDHVVSGGQLALNAFGRPHRSWLGPQMSRPPPRNCSTARTRCRHTSQPDSRCSRFAHPRPQRTVIPRADVPAVQERSCRRSIGRALVRLIHQQQRFAEVRTSGAVSGHQAGDIGVEKQSQIDLRNQHSRGRGCSSRAGQHDIGNRFRVSRRARQPGNCAGAAGDLRARWNRKTRQQQRSGKRHDLLR